MIEESEVERLKAVNAVHSKYQETLLPQKLQESTLPVLLDMENLLNQISRYLKKPLAQ